MTSAELISELQATRPAAPRRPARAGARAGCATAEPRRSPFAGLSLRRLERGRTAGGSGARACHGGRDRALALGRRRERRRRTTARRRRAKSAPPAVHLLRARRRTARWGRCASGSARPGSRPRPRPARSASARSSRSKWRTRTHFPQATQRALQVTRSLGGYAVSVSYGSAEEAGTASLVLRVPTAKVQDAIARLSEPGDDRGRAGPDRRPRRPAAVRSSSGSARCASRSCG